MIFEQSPELVGGVLPGVGVEQKRWRWRRWTRAMRSVSETSDAFMWSRVFSGSLSQPFQIREGALQVPLIMGVARIALKQSPVHPDRLG